MLKFVMVTLFASFGGGVEELSRVEYESIEECQAHKRQKEFTTFASEEGLFVFLCEKELQI